MALQLKATCIDMKTLRHIGSRKIGILPPFSMLAFARLSYGAEDVLVNVGNPARHVTLLQLRAMGSPWRVVAESKP
jgi:hypothetical protein